jgi:Uma2 family endonuclease
MSHPLDILFSVTAPITTTRVSVEEFLAGDWPADSWLVDGEVVVNDPGFQHQEVVARILEALRQWCTAASERGRAGFGGNWIFGPYTLLKPDVWWCAVRPTGNSSDAPPELAVEVRSPTTWRYDVGRKREIYEAAGVVELWLVDPEAATILVWRRPPGADTFDQVSVLGAGDDLSTPVLDGFRLSVDELFAGSG